MAAALPSVVLYLGPEEGEKGAAVNELAAAMAARHGDDVERHTFYAFDTPVDQVILLLRSGSLFGSAKIVRYRAAEALKSKGDIAQLAQYVRQPSPDALLILESSEVSGVDAVKRAVGPKNSRVFWEMFENQKRGWLTGYFRRHNVRIEPDAVELLLELVENNTVDLRHEADRLIAWLGESITVEDVDRYIYHAREESVFTLYDAIVAGDLDHALDILASLIVNHDAVQILLGLSWQIDRLLALQLVRTPRMAESALFEAVEEQIGQKIRGKRARASLLAAARRYPTESVRRIRLLTGDLDALLRSVPAAMHYGLLQSYLYSVIERGGAWSPAGTTRASQPWDYAAHPARRERW